MTTLREAAALALEALDSKYIVNCGAWQVQRDAAITALRTALAEPEQEPVTLTAEEIGDLWRKWVGTGRPNYSFAHSVIAAYQAKQEGKK
jgi:hypothetical protein